MRTYRHRNGVSLAAEPGPFKQSFVPRIRFDQGRLLSVLMVMSDEWEALLTLRARSHLDGRQIARQRYFLQELKLAERGDGDGYAAMYRLTALGLAERDFWASRLSGQSPA